MSGDFIVIDAEEFDKKKLRLTPAKASKGGAGASSAIKYDGKGLYVRFPESMPAKILAQWPYKMAEDEKTESNIKTFKVPYNLPGEDETYKPVVDLLTGVRAACMARFKDIADSVPRTAKALMADPNGGIKPLISTPKPPNAEGYSPSVFIELKYWEGKLNTVITTLDDRDPAGVKTRRCGIAEIRDAMGIVQPLVHIKDVFWGSMGDSGYGGTIRLQIHEMTWSRAPSAGPTESMLPPPRRRVALAIEEDDGVPARGNAARGNGKAKPAQIKDDDFEEFTATKKPTNGKSSKTKPASDEDDDFVEVAKPAKSKKAPVKAKPASDDETEEADVEEAKPVKSKKAPVKAKPASDDDESDPPPITKSKAQLARSVPSKKKPAVSDVDD